jgi:Fur family iron response transcriptional regulator
MKHGGREHSGGGKGAHGARTRERTAQLLRSHGIDPTRQRVVIARAILDCREHLSADQVMTRVNARHVETSKATVYNTLRLFVEKELIRQLIVDPARMVYDSNMAAHHHFYDVETGQLTDVPADGVQVLGLPPLPAGTVAQGVDIIVRTRRA